MKSISILKHNLMRAAMTLALIVTCATAWADITISSEADWNAFATNVSNGNTYSGQTVTLAADITVSTMAGSSQTNSFKGTFDGGEHTLTFNYNATADNAAPFAYLEDATIQNLHVNGTITTSKKFAAGIAAHTYGTTTIRNCQSSIVVNSSTSGDGTHGGFVGVEENGTLNITGCLFNGKLLKINNNTDHCGGFVGWRSSGTLNISDGLYMPAALEEGETWIGNNESATFARNNANITNCYYTKSFDDGTHFTGQGKQPHSITAGENVTNMVISPGSSTDTYNVSGITAYSNGLDYGGTLYYGNGDNVSLTLSTSLSESYFYYVTGGTLSSNGNSYTLTMPDADVTISAASNSNITAISSVTDWVVFCAAVNDGHDYSNETVTLTGNVTVGSENNPVSSSYYMAGTSGHRFKGTFNGQGNTLTFFYSATTDDAAPFAYLEGATIENLHVNGTIQTSAKYAAGIAAHTYGATITNCQSSIVVKSNISGDGTHGGFIAVNESGTLDITGCLFNGKLLTTNGTDHCGGFVGWRNGTLNITNSIYNPAEIVTGEETEVGATDTYTFGRRSVDNITNCYYTRTLGTAQGKQRHSITAGENVTIDAIALTGTSTPYNVSGITAYSGGGLDQNGTLYYGSGDHVSLTLSTTLPEPYAYSVTGGTLSGSGNSYMLNMPDADVTISIGQGANGGQELTVYDGTSTNAYVPFYSFYADYGTRSQFIIPASELTDLNGADISKLTFYYSKDNYTFDEGVTVYLKEVDYTTFSDPYTLEDWSTMTSVWTGPLVISDNKLEISFTEPYTYGGGNLMIGFQVTTWGSTCPSGNTWTGVTQSSNTALYNNANSSNTWLNTITPQQFLPKTTFTYASGYHVNAGTMSNGSIQFSTDGDINWHDNLRNIDADETVFISVEPEAGYQLSGAPTVTPTSGTAPTVSGSGNLYSFVMPESNVTVNATFNCTTPADPTFSVAGGTYTTVQNVAISCATAGATIYYTTDGSDPTSSSTQYTGAITINSTTTLKAIAYIGTCTSNVVSATYTMDLPTYTVACATGLTGGSIAASPASAVEGTTITITITATTESGYFLATLTATDGNNTNVPVTIDGNTGTFTMPASNVTVTATFTQGFQVTLNQTPNGTISADQTTGLQPGDIVTLTATPDNGCLFLAWYVFKDGNPRDVIALVNNSWFFMPSSNVTVQAVFVTEEEHEQTVGGGTNTDGNLPTNVYYTNSLTQQIYTAAEIGYNGRITAIAFKANGTAERTFDVYMAHTSKTAFSSKTDWQTMGPSFLVYHGDVSFDDSDWTTITLDTPFEYDGTSNLNICVVDITGEWVNEITFNTYSTSADRAMYVASDGTDYSEYVNDSNISSYNGVRSTANNQIKFTIKVPGIAESLTISPDAINDFSYEESQGPSETYKLDIIGVDLENDITVTAPTDFEISTSATGTYSSSVTIPRATGSKGSRTVTSWGFEEGLDGWTAVDADGDGYNWMLGSACNGVYLMNSSLEGHTGTGLVVSGSYTNMPSPAHALTPDNWLISPQVDLGGSFSMFAKASDHSGYKEHFGIYVSTASNSNTTSFTLLNEWTLPDDDWHEYSVDLSAYAGQTGYIAVRHYNCTDQFLLLVDDFELDTDHATTIEMPVTITPATVFVRMKDNLSAGTYSGTLTASAGTDDNLNGSVSLSGRVFLVFTKDIGAHTATGGWYLIASPLDGEVEVDDVEHLQDNVYDLYYFDQSREKEWVNYKDNESHTNVDPGFNLVSGKGYLYANSGDVTLTFTGTPYNGDGVFELEYLESNPDTKMRGWNLVGNPFAETASVDMEGFYRMNYGEGNTGGDEIILAENNIVEPMEGIFVKAEGEGEMVTFTPAAPSKGQDRKPEPEQVVLNLSRDRGSVIDRAIVRMGEGQTLPKFQIRENSTKLYIPQGGKDYAVVNAENQGEIPVSFRAEENGTYSLTFSSENVNFSYLHLIDNMTGADVDLLAATSTGSVASYTFNAKTTDYESRFRLVFVCRDADDDNDGDNETFAFYSNGNWIIANEGEATLQVIDLNGRILSNESVNGSVSKAINAVLGVYMIRLINGEKVRVQKIVVR